MSFPSLAFRIFLTFMLFLGYVLGLQQPLTTEPYRYFAYGSNMLPSTMKSLRNLRQWNATAAVLPKYRLAFDVPGNPLLEPSAASVRPCDSDDDDDCVHGVVYELSDADFAQVGRTEGVPFAYQWKKCLVYPYQGDGERAGQKALLQSPPKTLSAYTLVYPKKSSPSSTDHIPPSPSYLRILQQGAAYWKMDRSYQVALGKVTTAKCLVVKDGLAGSLLRVAELVNP